jgi:hypothetical protein
MLKIILAAYCIGSIIIFVLCHASINPRIISHNHHQIPITVASNYFLGAIGNNADDYRHGSFAPLFKATDLGKINLIAPDPIGYNWHKIKAEITHAVRLDIVSGAPKIRLFAFSLGAHAIEQTYQELKNDFGDTIDPPIFIDPIICATQSTLPGAKIPIIYNLAKTLQYIIKTLAGPILILNIAGLTGTPNFHIRTVLDQLFSLPAKYPVPNAGENYHIILTNSGTRLGDNLAIKKDFPSAHLVEVPGLYSNLYINKSQPNQAIIAAIIDAIT